MSDGISDFSTDLQAAQAQLAPQGPPAPISSDFATEMGVGTAAPAAPAAAPGAAPAPVQQTAGPSMQAPQTAPGAYTAGGDAGPTRMNFDQAQPLIRQTESGGQNVNNYLYPTDPTHYSASGFYQITDTNWKDYAGRLGIDTNQYPRAINAPEADQKRVAKAMYDEQGFKPWAPYNPRLAKMIGWQGGTVGAGDTSGMTPDQVLAQQAGAATGAFNRYMSMSQDALAHTQSLIDAHVKAENERWAKEDADLEKANQLREQKAKALEDADKALTDYANKTPTRQAVYASAMHITPMLAILTAIGGAATHTSGLAMLGAMNGLVQGVGQGMENRFTDAYNQWKTSYDNFKDHMNNMQQVYQGYIDAYQGRADAKEKAAEHARTSLQDQLSVEQLKTATSAQQMEAQFKLADSLANHVIALEKVKDSVAYRSSVSAESQTMNDRFLAQQILSSGDMNGVLGGAFGRSRFSLPDRERVMGVVQSMYAEQHANDPKYNRPGGDQLLAQDAANWVTLAKSNAQAAQRAQQAAATQAGGLEFAAATLRNTMPNLIALATYVDNTYGWTPLDRLANNTRLMANDPRVRAFVNMNQQAINDYKVIGARARSSTGEEREKNADQMSTGVDLKAYKAGALAVGLEMQSAELGAQQSMRRETYQPELASGGTTPLPPAPQVLSSQAWQNPDLSRFGWEPPRGDPSRDASVSSKADYDALDPGPNGRWFIWHGGGPKDGKRLFKPPTSQ